MRPTEEKKKCGKAARGSLAKFGRVHSSQLNIYALTISFMASHHYNSSQKNFRGYHACMKSPCFKQTTFTLGQQMSIPLSSTLEYQLYLCLPLKVYLASFSSFGSNCPGIRTYSKPFGSTRPCDQS